MNRWALMGFLAAFLAGCGEGKPRTLGTAIEGTATSILVAKRTNLETSLVLQGTVTMKCPVAGCWFMLKDESGTIKVDTKNAGFVVVDVPLNAPLTVSGRVTANGSERLIEATGLRY